MRIIVLGADGYLGFPVSLHLAGLGHTIHAVDNLSKRYIEAQSSVAPLIHLKSFHQRFREWTSINQNCSIISHVVDIAKQNRLLYSLIETVKPDAVIHFAEQPSAPYSMKGRTEAVETQTNNIVGTLNLLFAIKSFAPSCHIIKLGTMGEYGTPNIDIEEGWITITHNGRSDRLLYPKKPNSFYHLSKVHDSHNLEFACRNWGLSVTDLNQGIVYGSHTAETSESSNPTSFHYDSIFGTAINRFIVQALSNEPLTIYGNGQQVRAYLHIMDVLKCLCISLENPALSGEFKVRNQFTEYKSIMQLAVAVSNAYTKYSGRSAVLSEINNPRNEESDHYYCPSNSSFLSDGLDPIFLDESILIDIMKYVSPHIANVDKNSLSPTISWNNL